MGCAGSGRARDATPVRAGRASSTEMNVELLIHEVQKREPLYNVASPAYPNREVKDRLWREVAEAVGHPVASCKTRWKTLRDGFTRELKTMTSYGGCAPSVKRKRYIFFDQLTFLAPCTLSTRSTYSGGSSLKLEAARHHNSGSEEDWLQQAASTSYDPTTPTGAPLGDGSFLHHHDSSTTPSSTSTSSGRTRRPSPSSTHDEDDMFFRALLPSFRRIKPDRKSLLKIQISQLVHEALYGASPPGSV